MIAPDDQLLMTFEREGEMLRAGRSVRLDRALLWTLRSVEIIEAPDGPGA
jgi:hypothetical protein